MDEPTYRFSRRYSRPDESGWAGPTGRGSWALTLPRVPGDRRVLTRRPLDAPLGFSPLGPAGKRLVRDFAHTPPTCFAESSLSAAIRRHLGVSISAHLVPPNRPASRTLGQNNPFGVLAPVRSGALERATVRAMGSPRATPCIAADRPALLRRPNLALPELLGIAFGRDRSTRLTLLPASPPESQRPISHRSPTAAQPFELSG
jgi:hypothetical protein